MLSHDLEIAAVRTGVFITWEVFFEQLRSECLETATEWMRLSEHESKVPGIQPPLSGIVEIAMREIAHSPHPLFRREADNAESGDQNENDTDDFISRPSRNSRQHD